MHPGAGMAQMTQRHNAYRAGNWYRPMRGAREATGHGARRRRREGGGENDDADDIRSRQSVSQSVSQSGPAHYIYIYTYIYIYHAILSEKLSSDLYYQFEGDLYWLNQQW